MIYIPFLFYPMNDDIFYFLFNPRQLFISLEIFFELCVRGMINLQIFGAFSTTYSLCTFTTILFWSKDLKLCYLYCIRHIKFCFMAQSVTNVGEGSMYTLGEIIFCS